MNIFQMSFYGGILILVIAALRPIALNRLPKKTFLALWIIAFLRLLIPFTLPSAVSVYSIADGAVNTSRYTGEEFSETAVYESAASAVNPNEEAPSLSNLNQSPALPERRERFDFRSLASLAGIIGTALSAAFFITAYLKCYFEFKTSLPVKNDFADRWLREHKLKRPLAIRQSDRIKTPITYGVFRPVILMPKETDWENTAQLRYLLLHEYVHVCRFDSLLKLICTAAVCLHWFNPAAWLMYVLFNRDLELICDECTVKKSGLNTKAEYALALIAAEEKKAGITPFASGFGKNSVKERIAAIMKIKKTSVLTAAAAIILTVGVSAAFATTAADIQSENTDIEEEIATSGNAVDAALYKAYEPFGLTVASGKLYYDRQLVRCFDDRIPKDFFSVKAIGYYEKDGVIDLRAVRKNGLLTGLEVLSEEEFRAREIKDVSEPDIESSENDGAGIFEPYLEYGLSFDGTQNALFYGGKRVRLFWDSLSAYAPPAASEKPFIVTLSNLDGNGAVDLYVERDYKEKDENGYGKIIGLRIADKEEFESNSALFNESDGEIEAV